MDYDHLVEQILAAEASARKIAGQAHRQEETLTEDLSRETAALRESYMDRARKQLGYLRETESEFTRRSLQELDEEHRRRLAEVEDAYATHKERWVEALFRRVIEGRI